MRAKPGNTNTHPRTVAAAAAHVSTSSSKGFDGRNQLSAKQLSALGGFRLQMGGRWPGGGANRRFRGTEEGGKEGVKSVGVREEEAG